MGTNEWTTTLTIPGLGTLTCVCRVEWDTGHTRYKLAGPRVGGTVVIIPAYDTGYVYPGTARVTAQLGDCVGDHVAVRDTDRPGLPACDDVHLVGAPVIDLDGIVPGRPPSAYELGIGDLLSRSGGPVPATVRGRMIAVLSAVAEHWNTRPDNRAVRLAAARHAVRTGFYLEDKTNDIRRTLGRMADLRDELDRNIEQERQMLNLLTDPAVPHGAPF